MGNRKHDELMTFLRNSKNKQATFNFTPTQFLTKRFGSCK